MKYDPPDTVDLNQVDFLHSTQDNTTHLQSKKRRYRRRRNIQRIKCERMSIQQHTNDNSGRWSEQPHNQDYQTLSVDAQELMVELMRQDLVNHELMEQQLVQRQIIEQQAVFLANFVEEFIKEFSQKFIHEVTLQLENVFASTPKFD